MTVIHTCRLAVGLFALLCAGTATAQIDRMDVPTGSGPVTLLAQDWTDIGLITADDNWNGVSGIVGYRGDGMAGGTAINPQTVLGDGSGTPIDVIANQLTPNSLTTGGIAEFHLADPVVAFQGSGTARAPHLVLTVNTTGLTQIDVSYLLRDVDGGADNSIQPVALQYRVGTNGNYTNLPAGFVADASSGPGLATLVTPVDVILPTDAENQPVVQVRILTTDAIGSDEWIGVDDILITGVAPDSNTPPTVDAGGPYAVGPGGTITLDGTAIDPDAADTLVVTWSILPAGPTFADPADIDSELNGNGAAEGDYALTLTVDDGSGPVSDTTVLTVADTQPPIDVLYINEVHYDNAGTDVGEFIELAGTAGLDLSGWSLVLYNGANGQSYSTVNLGAFVLPDQDNGYGTVAITYPVNGIQNGNPDAMALVDGSTVVQFLSYGGVFAATNGPATGLTSEDIGVSQTGGAPIGSSLQLIGSGTSYADFTWTGPVDASPGQVNAGQSIGGGSPAFPPVAQCPGTFGVPQGVGGSAVLSASDPDDRIVSATIVAGAQPGTGLIDFVASPAVGEDASVVLQVAGSVALGSYPTTVRFTNDGAPQSVDCVVNVTVVASAGVVPISQIQGSGAVSPLAGQAVTVTAVVTSNLTGDLQGNQMGGFYIEEEQADRDADPATSEGIFVFAGAQSPSHTGLSVGDVVTVTGVAEEYFTQTQINASTGSITATGATATLPLPFAVSALPDSSAAAFAAAFEPIEGMRVQLADTWTVSENFDLHRLGELQLVPGTQPLQTATNIGPPGPEAGEFESDTQTEPRTTSLTLDDARNGVLSPANFDTPYVVPDVTGTLRRGSTIDDLVAIMAFDFGRYRLRPINDEANIVFTPAPRPAVPAVGGDVVVATFNVLNYFNGDGMGGGFPTSRGAETFAEFQRQTEKIVAALIELDADVVGLIEIENDGDAAIPSVRTLTEALNGALGVARYDYLVTGGRIGGDEIAQAFIYDTATVTLDGFAVLDNVDPFNRNTRPPLAARFTGIATGETFVPIVNHFKSKGTGSGPGNGNAGDGQALSNADRVLAAAELIDWVDTHAFFAADDRVLVIGDINAYAHEDPIVLFEDAGYVDLQDGQPREAYTYTFFGAEGRLDYALANPAALEIVTATAAWHINSDEPRGKDYTFFNQAELYEPGPYRSSDHDPVVIGLNLAGDPPVADSIRITEWMYDGAGGEFVELTNTGADAVDVTGWSYDDDSATPGSFDLSGLGVIQPGESVVFVESDPATFRGEWNLCAGIRIIGPYTNNLGRGDQINIFDAAGVRVDRLTYGDQVFPGSIRTQGASGWVSAAGLGADDVFAWTLSGIGDAESSVASVGGAIGSPGTSTRASVAFDACDETPPGPTLIPATIAAGSRFACGLDSSGLAYCWGSDSNGQLGNGAEITANMVSPYPVDLTTLPAATRFEAIVAGGSSACGLTADGLAYCWGQDNYGQLGNGAIVTADQPIPVAVDMTPLNGAVFVGLTVGATHACGVADDGIAYCWGRSGPLGLPAGVTGNQPSPSPVDMAALPVDTTFLSVDTASGHSCGLASDGNLYCWGRNDNGQLGIGVPGGQHPITAVNVSGLPAGTVFSSVTAGDSHSCALTTDDVAYCWGAGINGAVGNGAQSLDILLPNPVVTSTIPAGTYFTVLEGGGTNTCGILNTGAAYCWGFGNWGALGTGDGTSRYSPHPVATTTLPADTVFTELSADNNLTCAATETGEFYCWGRDDQGQQGNGPVFTTDPSLLPTPVFPFVPVEGLPPSITVAQPIVVGSVGDPTNIGTTLTIADPDTDIADLVIEVTTANASVIVPGAVTLTGDGAQRQVAFAPIGRGLSNVTFIVTDPEGNGQSATLQYASSNQAPDPSGRYHHHISDASAALDVGDGYSILLNDETNTIFLHRDDTTGLPVKTWSFNSGQLGTSSEIDFEGITRFGDQVLLTGSHGNSRNGPARPERRTFVAATISGSGADTELVFQGRYNNLWSELRTWDQSNGHGLGADALGFIAGTAPGVLPNPPGGFNIEGMAFSADGETVYLAFRAPTINIDGTYRALIVPLLNVEDLVNGIPGTGPAQFGAPLLVDLGGRSIRDMASNAEGDYLISAGPSPQNESWALYTWNGNPDDAPQFNRDLPAEDLLTGGTWEAIGAVPHPMVEGATVRLITDSGDSNFYGTGATKDLAQVYQKSYTQAFALAEVPGGEPAGGIRITEWMYDGAGGEFVELTNTGADAIDVTGWSYDDDSATPGGFDLSGLGVIQAGESVVFVESDPATFRGEWNLCPGIKIIGPYTNNLGRGDQINIFDAAGVRVDRLTYGDQVFPGSIRTQGASGWVSAAGLGADDVFAWTLSGIGDAESSVASVGGAIGSPGTSTRASVPYEPCGAIVEHTLVVDILGTGQGTITGDGIACPGDCEEVYTEGTQVTLTASAGAGFVFDSWGGDCTGTGECLVTMDAAKAVDATFIAAANIAIEPENLSATLVSGSTETQVLTLANSGDETLTWQLTDEGECALPAWIDVDPVDGSVVGGGTQAVDVTFDATGLAPAAYETELCVASNDPDQPTVNVPVSLTVTAIPAPVLTFDPVSLDFGEVEIGSTSPAMSATLRNTGDATATGLGFGTPGNGFVADVTACGSSIAAGGDCEVVISFTPAAAGDVDAVLEVESVDGASAALDLHGSGVLPPDPQTDLAVTVEAEQTHVQRGELVDYLITVSNTGPDTATAASVSSTLSSALDADFAEWVCVGPAASGCTESGQGDLVDSGLTIPAGGEVSYLISAPVRADADGEISTQVQVMDEYDVDPANNAAEAVGEVVVFRDGFESGSEGIVVQPLVQDAAPFVAGDIRTLVLPTPGGALVETVVVAAPDGAGLMAAAFRVDCLNVRSQQWARLVVRDEIGNEVASTWLSVSSAAALNLGVADGDAAASYVHLATDAGDVLLPLFTPPAAYRLWTVPVTPTPDTGNTN